MELNLNLKPLEKFQQTLSLATGLSLTVCAPTGKLVSHFSHPGDLIHPRILDSRQILKDVILSTNGKFRVAEGPGRLQFLIQPVIFEGRVLAYVMGGPVWEIPPSPPQREDLCRLLGMSGDQFREALLKHPAPVPLDVARGRDMIVSLAELTAQIFQDQMRQSRSLSTLAALYEVGTAISSTLQLEEVLRKVLDHAISLLEAENGSLMLLDEVRSELKMLVAQGLDEQIVTTTRVNLGEGISGWVAQEGRPRLLKKGIREDDSKSDRHPSEIESAMCVPLIVKDRCIGVLNLSGRRGGGDFSEQDLKVLTILASHAASAIDNAQLYEQVKRQVSELKALHDVSRALNSSLDLERVLPQVLEHATQVLEARAASVMLLDPQTQELSIRMAHGLSADVVRNTRVRLGERISGRVALEGKAVLLPHGRRDSDDIQAEQDLASALCVPLITQDKVVGVLNVRGKRDGSDFNDEDLALASRLAAVAAVAISNAELHDELQSLFVNSITALANSIDARDPYTRGHSERVTQYSVMIAEGLGFAGDELENIRYAGLLHDIGKIRIRDHILNKPGRLTDEEFAEMKRHPEYGVEIMWPVKAFHKVFPGILHHHEQWSGGGYPYGLKGEDIPLMGRILCVADSFDAMTSDRPYRKGMPVEQAVEEIKRNAGIQFDPDAARIFLRLIEEGRVAEILERKALSTPTLPNRARRIKLQTSPTPVQVDPSPAPALRMPGHSP
ncbi:MAG: GAF domain-containing protein [Candidatus Eremiobacterota bacterium]